MIKEFKTNPSTFNYYIAAFFFTIIILIAFYLTLNVIPYSLIIFPLFIFTLAFWSKDRVLITLHKDYLEAKEAIASKKKLIRYKEINKIKEHKTGAYITIYLKKESKTETIILNSIKKSERKEFIELLNNIMEVNHLI